MLDTRERITVGLNLPSAALGGKDLIKVENTLLTEDQVVQLAFIRTEGKSVNIIEDFLRGEETSTPATGTDQWCVCLSQFELHQSQ